MTKINIEEGSDYFKGIKKGTLEYDLRIIEVSNRDLRDAIDECEIKKIYNEKDLIDKLISGSTHDIDKFTPEQEKRFKNILKDQQEYFSDIEKCECKKLKYKK